MKIAVNTRLLIKDKLEGIGWFTKETLSRITRCHPEHDFIFIFDRKFDDTFIFNQNISPVKIFPQARHPFLYYIWFEYSVPKILKSTQADVFLSPDGYLSLSSPVPSIQVIHDLNFEHYPDDLPVFEQKYYNYYFPKFAHKASRIATVSQFSKNDIIEQYAIESEKIDVLYNGANTIYQPSDENQKKLTLKKYTEGHPYFLFVGSLHPRKNLVNLFKAFDIFKKNDNSGIKLLIVGAKKWWTNAIEEAYNNLSYKRDVLFTGRLGLEELNKVMGAALSLTYISYFEGFGIPIVEAMQAEVPVITSGITSMPEIAGNAALLVNPFDPDNIASAMTEIARNEKTRMQLIEKGKIQCKKFSWDKTAERLWQTIEKVLNQL
ncbi:MAG: glycosyltransferase family 4 protein [Lentimicrobiaceae bacterium]|nr:glycosyltransferase family 4 protein [Lentimicrobiaceae bacterium]